MHLWLGVSQISLLIFVVVAFIIFSGKLILFCFQLVFVTIAHVQLIPSSVHSYNEAIIAPWQMVNWGPKVQKEASIPQRWALGQLTRWLASPDLGLSENVIHLHILVKSWAWVRSEPCPVLGALGLSPQNTVQCLLLKENIWTFYLKKHHRLQGNSTEQEEYFFFFFLKETRGKCFSID